MNDGYFTIGNIALSPKALLHLSKVNELSILFKMAFFAKVQFLRKDGSELIGLMSAKLITLHGRPHIISVTRDITERKQTENQIRINEARLSGLVRILQYPAKTTQELLDYALNEVIQLTESRIGYIYFYHEDRKEFVLNTWSKDIMKECEVVNPQTVYELEKTGIWGEAVRQRKPIILNNFQADHPLKKGYPEGHVHLTRFMTVPVFKVNRIVAVVGVANKSSNYNETDVFQLTLLMNTVWKSVDINRAEEEIRSLSKFPSENPFPVLRVGQDGTILYANAASEALLKSWKCKIGKPVSSFWCDAVKTVLATQTPKTIDVEFDGRVFSFTISPVLELNYANLYGSDITERKRAEDHLKQMIERFDLSTRAGRMGVWDWDVQKNQLVWDDRMYELYGIRKQDFSGAYEAWLNGLHPDDVARSDEESKKALSGEKEYDTEFRVVWPDKTIRFLKAHALVLRDTSGKPLRMTGINYDITEQRKSEEKLKFLLKEKEVLIREVHHRVKNNFVVVSSLLNLQSYDIQDKDVKEMFMQSRDRINSMALIHERLYQAHDLTHINLSDYFRTLATDLYKAYNTDFERVSLVTEIEDIVLDVDKVIPCGLIVNELIINALKYGFPKNWTGKGQIKVTLHKIDGDEVELVVMDNGVGLPEGFDIYTAKSLGLKVVTMLAESQLDGKLTVSSQGGASFQIQFSPRSEKE